MLFNYIPRYKTRPLLQVLVCLFFLLYISNMARIEVKAQSNCPIQSDQTVGWTRNSTGGVTPVKYFLSGSFNGQQSQITSAFTKWNQAMATTCLKVNFVPGAEGDYDLLVTYSPDQPTQGGIDEDYPTPGTSGAININPNDFNTGLPSYNTILLKATLHEIGHTLGLGHPVGTVVAGGTVMNPRINKDDTTPAPNGLVPTEIQPCDKTSINHNPQCPISYTRPSSIGPGSFPVSMNPQTGAMTTVTHAMSVSDYNATTGSFTIRFTDYTTSRQNYQGPVTNSAANPDPYVVINNIDQCINRVNGSILNLSFTNGPVFGCSFTKQISLTQTGTENYAPPNGGNSGPFIKVYTGTTDPNSGIPYMHFLHTLSTGNVAYAHNAPSQ